MPVTQELEFLQDNFKFFYQISKPESFEHLVICYFPFFCTQKKVWLEPPEFRLFQPEQNVTDSSTGNSG